MMKRFLGVLLCGTGLLFLPHGSGLCAAEPPHGDWLDVEGFRGLPWGATAEKAKAVFPDLAFVRFAVTDERAEPSTVFERKREDRKIEGIRFDEILYWFRNGSFYGVTATLGSKVGPRTLGTPAEDGFDRLRERLDRFAGPPVEDRTHRSAWGGNRRGAWDRGDLHMELSFFEPPGGNGEELVLKVLKGPASRGRVP